jgi:hypothetical protein
MRLGRSSISGCTGFAHEASAWVSGSISGCTGFPLKGRKGTLPARFPGALDSPMKPRPSFQGRFPGALDSPMRPRPGFQARFPGALDAPMRLGKENSKVALGWVMLCHPVLSSNLGGQFCVNLCFHALREGSFVSPCAFTHLGWAVLRHFVLSRNLGRLFCVTLCFIPNSGG